MDLGLNGKVALVSGGSKGMGRATAEELAREGTRVLVVARGQDAIDETVEAIRQAGGDAHGLSADMTDPAAVGGAVEACVHHFGTEPDIAIANVYGTARHSFETATPDVFREGYELLVMSAVHLARAVVPGMKRKGWGRIVTIGSFCVKKPHWQIPLIVDNVTRSDSGLEQVALKRVGPVRNYRQHGGARLHRDGHGPGVDGRAGPRTGTGSGGGRARTPCDDSGGPEGDAGGNCGRCGFSLLVPRQLHYGPADHG